MINDHTKASFVFGPFRLEPATQRLFKNEQHLPLPRKRFEILLLLIENAGRLLSKEEILQSIWPNQFIEEANLTQHIYVLRRMIEEDSKNPSYIITVPGSGYLFSATVERVKLPPQITLVQSLPDDRSEQPNVRSEMPQPAGLTSADPASRQSWRSRLGTGLVGLLIVVMMAGGYIWWRADRRRPSIDPISKPLLTLYGLKKSVAYSPNGTMIAFSSESETSVTTDLYIKTLGEQNSVRLTDTAAEEFDVTWSPDGQRLAFLRWPGGGAKKYELILKTIQDGNEQIISEVENGVDWSPDGRYLAIGDHEGASVGIHLLALENLKRTPVSRPPQDRDTYDNLPRFSPTGDELVFVRWQSGINADIHLVDLRSGKIRQLTTDQATIRDLQFSADGRAILFVSNRNGNQRLWEIPTAGGTPSLVTSIPDEVERIAISPVDNHLAYTQRLIDTATEIFPLPVQGKAAGSLPSYQPVCQINSSRTDDSPMFSPDGRMICFISNRTGFDEIWISNSDCTKTRQLTSFREASVGSPRWAPDGRRIVFDRHVDGQSEIFMVELESRMVTRLTNDPAPNFLPSWSADGTSFYFCSDKTGRPEIWKQPIAGGVARQITQNGGWEAFESSDGRQLYYTRLNSMWSLDLASGATAPISELAGMVIKRYWTISPDAIYFVPYPSNVLNRLELRNRKIQPIAKLPGFASTQVPGISISADQKMAVGSYINYRFGDIMVVSNWR